MRTRVRYSGRVQGVGFRATIRSIADRHSATGWVRNEPDGSVLLEIQAESAAVHAALAEIRSTLATYIHGADETPLSDEGQGLEFVIEPQRTRPG